MTPLSVNETPHKPQAPVAPNESQNREAVLRTCTGHRTRVDNEKRRSMNQALIFLTLTRRVRLPLVAVMLSLAGGSAMVAAQTTAAPPATPSTRVSNPLDRNPLNRSGVPDTATVLQDIRDSTTRPTLPAAPSTPDIRDADKQPPDATRDAQLPPPQLVPVKP